MKFKITKRSLLQVLFVLSVLLSGSFYSTASAAKPQKPIKILAIGNSFSEDAIEQYLHELAAAEGIETVIGNLYIGGCSLERHVNNIRDNAPAYDYRKIGLDGVKVNTKNVSIATALAEEDWDYVSLQQASPLSGIYDSYAASLPELQAYVLARIPAHTKLILHQTWAYAANSTHDGFKNYDKDQMKMFTSIVDAVQRAGKLSKIKIIVPSGTAIQNARTSFIGDNMNRDGYHLNLKYGRYTAACTWFESIFKRNVIGNPYAPQGVTCEQKVVAQEAAHDAVKHPNRITDLSKLDVDKCCKK